MFCSFGHAAKIFSMAEDQSRFCTITIGPLEQRIPRLSINIGAHISTIANPQEREMVLGSALIKVLEGFLRCGQPIEEAAQMADDVIAAARLIAARLTARLSTPQIA